MYTNFSVVVGARLLRLNQREPAQQYLHMLIQEADRQFSVDLVVYICVRDVVDRIQYTVQPYVLSLANLLL